MANAAPSPNMSTFHVDDDWFAKQITNLRLDTKKCPIAKVNEIMGLLKTKVDFKFISAKPYSQTGKTYLVEAESNGMTAHGKSGLSPYDAQKNAAFNLFEKLHYRYCVMSSIYNSKKQNSKQTVFTDNNVSSSLLASTLDKGYSSKFKEPKEITFNNKRNTLNTALDSNCSSNLLLKKYNTADNYNHRYDSTLTPTSLDSSSKTKCMNSDKKNAGEYYISLLFEKCIYRDWKLPKYNISELNYDCYGSPELTAVCLLLSKTTQGKGATEQIAKNQAAFKMYELVNELYGNDYEIISENKTPFNYFFNDIQFQNREKVVSVNTLKDLKMFFDQWKIYKDLSSSHSYKKKAVNVLGKIAKAENFLVKYVVILQKPDQVNIMVQILMDPIVMHIGHGTTKNKAQGDAAFATLVYLQTKFNYAM